MFIISASESLWDSAVQRKELRPGTVLACLQDGDERWDVIEVNV